ALTKEARARSALVRPGSSPPTPPPDQDARSRRSAASARVPDRGPDRRRRLSLPAPTAGPGHPGAAGWTMAGDVGAALGGAGKEPPGHVRERTRRERLDDRPAHR